VNAFRFFRSFRGARGALATLSCVSVASTAALVTTASCSDDAATSTAAGDASTDSPSRTGDGGPLPPAPLDCTTPLAITSTFGTAGVVRLPASFTDLTESTVTPQLFPQADGSVVVGVGKAIALLRPDGVVDQRFQPDYVFADPDHEREVVAVTVDADGALIALWKRDGETPSSPPVFELGRLAATGKLDPAFGNGGITALPDVAGDGGAISTTATHLTFGADGAIYVWGTAAGPSAGSGPTSTFVTKLDGDGHAVTEYGNGPNGIDFPLSSPYGIAPRADGHALLGVFVGISSAKKSLLFSVDSKGAFDPSFGADGGVEMDFAKSRAELYPLTSGDTLARGDYEVRKMHPTGQLDPAFGGDGGVAIDYAERIATRSDGTFAILGAPEGSSTYTALARFDASGKACGAPLTLSDPDLSTSTPSEVAFGPTGAIFVARWDRDDGGNERGLRIAAFR
jgi:hypothetical protein